tara:strand:- start:414 stop:596 length:183 start_codon:yes stop_codon:yes gene_type:complete
VINFQKIYFLVLKSNAITINPIPVRAGASTSILKLKKIMINAIRISIIERIFFIAVGFKI